MLKKAFTAVALTLTLAWAAPASAFDVIFDPSATPGAGGDLHIDVFDPTVGNSLAINASSLSVVGTQVTALFQANLGSATLGGAPIFANGDNGFFFTVVASFHEVVLSNSGGLFPTVVLGLDGSQPSFFDIYAVPTSANNLDGTGFIAGAPILSGVFINSGAAGDGITSFTFTGTGAPLDDFTVGDNDYPGVTSLTGGGSFRTTVLVTGKNALYFPDIVLGQTLALVTSQLNLNYTQVDPSRCFSNNGITECNQVGVGTVGPNNGISGPNMMFQTDASAAFQPLVASVPEPATLTLLGIGGLAAGFRRRRNRATK